MLPSLADPAFDQSQANSAAYHDDTGGQTMTNTKVTSSVRSAEAHAVSTAREYDSLRDGTLEQVTDLFAQIQSQEDLLTLVREDILPKARLTLEVSRGAYNVGEIDFLQLIDNWRQLLRYEVNYHRLEASLRQTLAELERVIGKMIEIGRLSNCRGSIIFPMSRWVRRGSTSPLRASAPWRTDAIPF